MSIHRVYTDGACIGVEPRRFAGCGVYWGRDDDERNVSAPLPTVDSSAQTNQRAELQAIVWALERIVEERRCELGGDLRLYVLVTDSRYAIDCITTWRRNWQRNGWLTANKEPVRNRDLIERAGELYDSVGVSMCFEWVKGHAGNAGNCAADALATRAAAAAAAKAAAAN